MSRGKNKIVQMKSTIPNDNSRNKKTAEFICDHVDPVGIPIKGYYNTDEDIYYITYEAIDTEEKEERVVSQKGSEIKENLLFDPFSELKIIHRG